MSEIVNLKRVRKEKARKAKQVVAEANRIKHGVSKSAHKKAKVLATKARRDIEGHRLDED
jgi:Domain of unknown function (DUF4169)